MRRRDGFDMEVVKKSPKTDCYSKFDQIDGSHPFKKAVPDGYVDYRARRRKDGKLVYFNYELARRMGLIPKGHPDKMTKELEQKILATFSIVIINEYDEMNNTKIDPKDILPGTFMATRYLQLQHPDKKGLTSGDGRSVWNGQIKHQGKVWDISSCGTGATRLSPATSKYKRFFKTGDPTISYGCGYAELDEGLASAIFSEVFHKNNLETEQTLALIEFQKGLSINVRAHQNLLRPSHILGHLKQRNLKALKATIDYYIDVERHKTNWSDCPSGEKKYQFFLQKVCETFAKTAAIFESEYIFCWLDWDGDNILMDGGIIDYGSVRQFGLFHYEYRYDDVERFSTNILEQKAKAKYIVQSLIQAVDFVLKGKAQGIDTFKKHKLLKDFETIYETEKNRRLLGKLGFDSKQSEYLLSQQLRLVNSFKKNFYYFERAKSAKGPFKIPDGVTWDAIFCMRDLMRELPQIYLSRMDNVSPEEFIEILKSAYASKKDLELTVYRKKMIHDYQRKLWKLIDLTCNHFSLSREKLLLQMGMRSSVINKIERVTGDSITYIVDYVMKKRGGIQVEQLYQLIRDFSEAQKLIPVKKNYQVKIEISNRPLMRNLIQIVKEHREGI